MAVIRVVLAATLAAALVGVGLPVAERAERNSNADLAEAELETLADAVEELAATNDPAEEGATMLIEVRPPESTVTSGGRIVIDDDRLRWWPDDGVNRTVESTVPMHTDGTLIITESTRIRLSLVERAGEPIVRLDRPNVETRSRTQTEHALSTP